MPIYMDIHNAPGVTPRDVAKAHQLDLLAQEEHGCKCMTYWIDEKRESVFCLIEAPCMQDVEELHKHSHGLLPSKVIEVDTRLVESFLGRIYDPNEAETSEEGLKIFHDPSFRILLVTRLTDPVLLKNELGTEKANELLNYHNIVIRKNLSEHGGKEVEHGGTGFIVSFVSAAKAISCALAIQKNMQEAGAGLTGFRIAINAGEPVENSNKLFGDTIAFANQLCSIAGNSQIAVASPVKELLSKDHFQNSSDQFLTLSPQDEIFLQTLFAKLEEKWQDPEFDISGYCQSMAMSQSQLYRKTTALTGMSCNILLKEYRLEKAKQLMKKKHYSISQITFDSGFSSPSYFTKCFKKKYGLLPMAYIDLLH